MGRLIKLRLPRRLRSLRAVLLRSSKQSIMWLLLLLVALFVAAMSILSSLNLDYSQRAMAGLREAQIEEAFLVNLNRISARQRRLELYTEGLARIGELLGTRNDLEPQALRAQVEAALRRSLADFEGASGVGIWFEPGVLAAPGRSYASYLYQADAEQTRLLAEQPDRVAEYRRQPWYPLALATDWRPTDHVAGQVYWTPVYFNELTEHAVLTAVSPMFSAKGHLLGMVTTDWESEQVIDLVSRVHVTTNSFSFLLDRGNRRLTSLSRNGDPLQAQQIMDAVVAEDLAAALPPGYADLLSDTDRRNLIQTRSLAVQASEYLLLYAGTPAGMLFGIGVPQAEIDAVLAPMRDSNYRILFITSLSVLLLSTFLVHRIAGLMRELEASYTDSLTGLANRARLLLDLHGAGGATLMQINIDRFREINSLFGHACGDQVLRTLGGRLQQFIATNRPLRYIRLYRLPGDEFALLGPAVSNEQLQQFLQALSDFLQDQRVMWEDQEISVGASVGVACRTREESDGDESPDSLLSQATVALRGARTQLRNYQIYDTDRGIERLYQQNLIWARHLKEALQNNRIVPCFQPIQDNVSGRIAKYECLVRMRDSQGELVSAGRFLGVAHKLRLDREITRIMVEKCFAVFADQACDFSINLSYADLEDPELMHYICDRLQESGIGPRVIFEILESDGIENYSEMCRFIDQVKVFGCRIAIDDFGTGYSNFEHLLRLKVDLIKIDGSLIRQLHEDKTVYLVTQGIVQFARSLGIGTVAEFVHCAAVQDKVLALGIDFSQGGYIGMPRTELLAVSETS